jgi:predicted deacylase
LNKTKGKRHSDFKIAILGGVHANESIPNLCLKIFNDEFRSKLEGIDRRCISLYPSINLDGIQKHVRESPASGTDLNRGWSGRDPRNIISDVIFNYNDNSYKFNVVIDVHSSPNISELILIDNDMYTGMYVDFCKKLDINYIVRTSPNFSSIKSAANHCDASPPKYGFTLELNGMDIFDMESTKKGSMILTKIILNLNLLSKDSYYEYKNPPDVVTFRSPYSGYVLYDLKHLE